MMRPEALAKFRKDMVATIGADLAAARAKASRPVTFTQGDYNVIMREIPALITFLSATNVEQQGTIAALERRLAMLEGKFERRLEIVREAALSARSIVTHGVKIDLADPSMPAKATTPCDDEA